METLYRVPFLVLECPNLKLKKPPWVHMPSAMTVYALVVVSYFLITGGIIYDVIVEPPSVGSMTDEHGHQRPVAFLAYRVNGQYIMEGLASSFLFTMGGLGFIILDRSNAPNIPKLNRFLLLFIGFVCVLLSFFMARVFMRMKLPVEIVSKQYDATPELKAKELPLVNGWAISPSYSSFLHMPPVEDEPSFTHATVGEGSSSETSFVWQFQQATSGMILTPFTQDTSLFQIPTPTACEGPST
ncbi:Oligosaccharyltransferase complex subunit OSTC [Sciurus carolinensis]|uniref:Oligosaccharyltransferase complex subunit n=1 Tax=Sciurus carolinensis TaxID=30640 RepID=A0AA41T5Y2_SCICA|nr:Oligosaccharyltransferase complex subunit OSTC [Sciurus carolinensis]